MDNKLQKSLTDLIDETLQELDELRKSRFAASEIKIEGPGEGIAGKPSDGDLHAKKGENDAAKAEDKDDKDEDDDKDEAKKKEMEKGVNDEAEKADAEKAEKAEKPEEKKEDKKDDKKDDDKEDVKAAFAAMKKSFEESDSLMKSYVEERVKPLEEKLTTILDLVNKIADQPVAPKGVTAREVAPLTKSDDAANFEPLTKSQVAGKLFELKKSGANVDSLDITKAEMGQDLQTLIKKYEIS